MDTYSWRAEPLTRAESLALNPYAVVFWNKRRWKMYAWCKNIEAAMAQQELARERYGQAEVIDRSAANARLYSEVA